MHFTPYPLMSGVLQSGCIDRHTETFLEQPMTKFDRLVIVMGDGEWHSTEELVQRVGHRFSATKHIAEKRGYRFDRRRQGQQFEYRMLPVRSVVGSVADQ